MDIYYAMFLPLKEGGYGISFLEFDEAFSEGETIEECFVNAAEVLTIAIKERMWNNNKLPTPRTYDDVAATAEEIVLQSIEFDSTRDYLVQGIVAPDLDNALVRFNTSLRKYELDELDKKAELLGYTRSKFIAVATEVYNINNNKGE